MIYKNIFKKEKLGFLFISIILFMFLLLNSNYIYSQSNSTSYLENDCIIINLQEGWNYFSSNIIPENENIEIIFSEIQPFIEDLKIVVAGSSPPEYISIYNSNKRNFTQTNFDYKKGYKIKVSSDVNLEICGQKVNSNNSNNQIFLEPGYNLISYLSNEQKTINDLFLDYNGNIEQVKDLYSFSTFYNNQYYGSLINMYPGNAYLVKLSKNSTGFNIVFPITKELVPITEINLEAYPENRQFINYQFRIDLTANQGVNELVDISIDFDSNYCQFICSNNRSIYSNHIDLYSQNLEDQLNLTFVCYEPKDINFDFTVIGQESNNILHENIIMNIVPIGRDKNQIEETKVFHLDKGWNYFSSNLVPVDSNISTFFSEIIPYLEEVQILKTTNLPLEYFIAYNSENQSWNCLYFNYRQGYKIKVSEDVNFTITGYKVPDTGYDNQILIYPGYNLISYLLEEPISLNELFANYTGIIEIIKSRDEFAMVYNNQYYGSLITMEPGQAYIMKVDDDINSFYFEYPVLYR
jgi:hypothetical protein